MQKSMVKTVVNDKPFQLITVIKGNISVINRIDVKMGEISADLAMIKMP